jgi:hypothetical protein
VSKDLSVFDVQEGLRQLAGVGHDLTHGVDMVKLQGQPYFSTYNNLRRNPHARNWTGISNINLGENGAIAHVHTHTDSGTPKNQMVILTIPHARVNESGQLMPNSVDNLYAGPSTVLPREHRVKFHPDDIWLLRDGELDKKDQFLSRHSGQRITNLHELLSDLSKNPSAGGIDLPDGSKKLMTPDQLRAHRAMADPRRGVLDQGLRPVPKGFISVDTSDILASNELKTFSTRLYDPREETLRDYP